MAKNKKDEISKKDFDFESRRSHRIWKLRNEVSDRLPDSLDKAVKGNDKKYDMEMDDLEDNLMVDWNYDDIKNRLKNIDWKQIEEKSLKVKKVLRPVFDLFLEILENLDTVIGANSKVSNLRYREIYDYLGIGTQEVYELDEGFTKHEIFLAMYAVNNLIKDKFNCKRIYNAIEEDYLTMPSYTSMAIDYDKSIEVISVGACCLEYKKTKFVLEIETSKEPPCLNLTIYIDKKKNGLATEILKIIKDYMDDNNFYKGKKLEVYPGGYLTIMNPIGKTWDDIVIDSIIRSEIEDNVINLVAQRDIYKQNKIPLSRGIILNGSYGLGKTLLCQILCEAANCTVFFVTPKALYDPMMVRYIYETAVECGPSLVVLEDIDTFTKDRDLGSREDILGELMNQLNGLEEKDGVITIATTNRLEVIEKALKDRPGRFDRVLTFELPTEEQRKEILKRLLTKYKIDGIDLDVWAKKTEGYSGAYLNDLVKTAVMQAVKQKSFIGKTKNVCLNNKHVEEAFQRLKKVKTTTMGFRKA